MQHFLYLFAICIKQLTFTIPLKAIREVSKRGPKVRYAASVFQIHMRTYVLTKCKLISNCSLDDVLYWLFFYKLIHVLYCKPVFYIGIPYYVDVAYSLFIELEEIKVQRLLGM